MTRFSGFDVIGDVHGCYAALRELLDQLGYVRERGRYRHRDRRRPRQVLFLGDLIDRGPAIRDTVLLVQEMAAAGQAQLILGNHEHHAVLCCTPAPAELGRPWLRPRTERNMRVLEATLEEFANHPLDWRDFLAWCRTLPLFLDMGSFRLIHACWDERLLGAFRERCPDGVIDAALLLESATPGTFGARLLWRSTSGLTLQFPEGRSLTGQDGVQRRNFRSKFWVREPATLGDLEFQPDRLPDDLAALPLSDEQRAELVCYDADQPPLLVGHYWLRGRPRQLTRNIACLDYSAVLHGRLVAYRMDGEREIDNSKFVWVDGTPLEEMTYIG
ncbi:MAG: metallophosphoesterase [Spongiibacteraceae bacterium]|jgi:hypothetical protein|nr:metallophosphoesterase [Spongiibacteraceae bacterium]